MGAATMIATGIAIILLILTGYILIGGTLSTARIVALAQQAAAEREAQRMHTQIRIHSAVTDTSSCQTVIEVNNTGSEVLGTFDRWEVYLLQDGTPYMYLNRSAGGPNWTYFIEPPDQVNPGLLDPDEVVNITVPYESARGDATWVKVVTANGVYDSAYTVVN
jgi:flagellar protein FlaF